MLSLNFSNSYLLLRNLDVLMVQKSLFPDAMTCDWSLTDYDEGFTFVLCQFYVHTSWRHWHWTLLMLSFFLGFVDIESCPSRSKRVSWQDALARTVVLIHVFKLFAASVTLATFPSSYRSGAPFLKAGDPLCQDWGCFVLTFVCALFSWQTEPQMCGNSWHWKILQDLPSSVHCPEHSPADSHGYLEVQLAAWTVKIRYTRTMNSYSSSRRCCMSP